VRDSADALAFGVGDLELLSMGKPVIRIEPDFIAFLRNGLPGCGALRPAGPIHCGKYSNDPVNVCYETPSVLSSAGCPLLFRRANTPPFAQKGGMNITKNFGMLLLAIYLILVGLMSLVHITIPAILMGILALVAGILILIGK
jgi:hypothetical protein